MEAPTFRQIAHSHPEEHVLFAVGAYKAQMTVGHPTKSGLEMAVIGTLSALVGYMVGALLKLPTTP